MKKHKKYQISILQTNGSLVTFLFESSPISDFVTALKTLLHTEKYNNNYYFLTNIFIVIYLIY